MQQRIRDVALEMNEIGRQKKIAAAAAAAAKVKAAAASRKRSLHEFGSGNSTQVQRQERKPDATEEKHCLILCVSMLHGV